MGTKTIANECVLDLQTKMRSIPAFTNKVIYAYTEDDLYDITSQINFPGAGILYEGLRSVPDPESKNVGKGRSAELHCNLILLVSGKTIGNADYKLTAAEFLDQFRGAIMGTRSPTGNFWKFIVESPVEARAGIFAYGQRWSTSVILT